VFSYHLAQLPLVARWEDEAALEIVLREHPHPQRLDAGWDYRTGYVPA
jgi:hypothetical protein